MHYLSFDLSDDDHGVATLEALASTAIAQHAAVMAEVRQVLDWAWRAFPHTHGPVEDGGDWHHDLQVDVEPGGWHAMAFTIVASPAFVREFFAEFGAHRE